MALTPTAKEFYKLYQSNEFITSEVFENYLNKFKAEKNPNQVDFAVSHFIQVSCPKCNTYGAYKWHFLGRLHHPACGWTWYLKPGEYIITQLKAVFRSGFTFGSTNEKGEKGGCLLSIIAVLVRLPFALLMIPVQAVVSLTQQKPDKKESSN